MALTVRVLVQREEVTEKVTAEILPPRVTDWVWVGALLDIEHIGDCSPLILLTW